MARPNLNAKLSYYAVLAAMFACFFLFFWIFMFLFLYHPFSCLTLVYFLDIFLKFFYTIPIVVYHCCLGDRKGIRSIKNAAATIFKVLQALFTDLPEPE